MKTTRYLSKTNDRDYNFMVYIISLSNILYEMENMFEKGSWRKFNTILLYC